MVRALSILLSVLIAVNTAVGGIRGVTVVCFGGCDSVATESVDSCESACSHAPASPSPLHTQHDHEGCDCVDIEVTPVRLLAAPRVDTCSVSVLPIATVVVWMPVASGAEHAGVSPPTPPWFDPGARQRLAVITSTRIII